MIELIIITGEQGSGKSTEARNIAKKMYGTYIEVDSLATNDREIFLEDSIILDLNSQKPKTHALQIKKYLELTSDISVRKPYRKVYESVKKPALIITALEMHNELLGVIAECKENIIIIKK